MYWIFEFPSEIEKNKTQETFVQNSRGKTINCDKIIHSLLD